MINSDTNRQLGFYICDGKEFSSKILACIHGETNNKPVEWNFNKEFFSSVNWKIEPEESLDRLYDERAQQIRQSNDYVILSYSGGSDSHNVLMSFLRQGLHIDEILVNTVDSKDNLAVHDTRIVSSWNSGAEYKLQTVERLKYIKTFHPNIKITVCDMSQSMFDTLEGAEDASWILRSKEKLNLGGALRYNYIYFKEVRNRFDKNKKIAIVTGVDKPRTCIDRQGNFYLFFNDRAVNVVNAQEHFQDYTNTTIENFYWSPDASKILVKQAHVIKKWIENNQTLKSIWILKDQEEYGSNFRRYHETILKNVIYSTWDNSWFQSEKSTSDWYNEFDTWFYKNYQDSKAYSVWKSGLEYVEKNAGDYVLYKNGNPFGLKSFYQFYKIGEFNDSVV